MTNKPGPSNKFSIEDIKIVEISVGKIEILGTPEDRLDTLAAEVRADLEKIGFPGRQQAALPPAPSNLAPDDPAPQNRSNTVLRLAVVVGTFVLAYKGCDVLLHAAFSPEGSQGVAKSMGEWLAALSPLIGVIVGAAASAGVAHVTRRR